MEHSGPLEAWNGIALPLHLLPENSVNIRVFRKVTPCNIKEICPHFGETYLLYHQDMKFRKRSKLWYCFTRIFPLTSQKAIIFRDNDFNMSKLASPLCLYYFILSFGPRI